MPFEAFSGMASEAVRGAEFWLPSEFLTDDFFSTEKTIHEVSATTAGGDPLCLPNEFPYDSDSSKLGSPIDSNTETESDEEDLMVGVTRRIACSSVHDDEKKKNAGNITTVYSMENIKASMSCSPQSTRYSAGAWSKGPCQVSSPPPPQEPENSNAAAWELLYAAAGEVFRMRLREEEEKQRLAYRGLPGPPKTGYHNANLALTQYKLQLNQFQRLKQQQFLKQQEEYSSVWGRQTTTRPRCGVGLTNGRVGGRPMGISSWSPLQQQRPAPPPSQQQGGSGMRAVFLNGSGARRQSSGTGVFLPRRVGSPPELRKKSACSTVLVPARVIQALNLNLDDISPQPRLPGGFVLDDQETLLDRKSAMMMGSQKKVLRPQPAASPLSLPPEWTY